MAPDDLISTPAFLQPSGYKTNEKSVSKVFEIVDMSRCTKKICDHPKQHFTTEPGKVGLLKKAKLLRSSATSEMVELWCRLEL